MTITVRKLSTDDILVFDQKNYESYVVKPIQPFKPSDDLLSLAKELVANGRGVHLNRGRMNQLMRATSPIYILG